MPVVVRPLKRAPREQVRQPDRVEVTVQEVAHKMVFLKIELDTPDKRGVGVLVLGNASPADKVSFLKSDPLGGDQLPELLEERRRERIVPAELLCVGQKTEHALLRRRRRLWPLRTPVVPIMRL